MTHDNRGNLRFSEQVGPSSTKTLKHEIRESSTIERLVVRIYPGAELDLQVRPFVELGEDGPRRPLLTYEGKQYIDGDDDVWTFDLVETVNPGDYVGVEVENTNSSYAYDFAVHVSIDPGPEGSLRSIFGGIL